MSGYSGWVPTLGESTVAVLHDKIAPAEFFEDYISKRKPAVITGAETEQHAAQVASSLLDTPSSLASRSVVEVEHKASGAFGRGESTSMTYLEFLSELIEKGTGQHFAHPAQRVLSLRNATRFV